MSWVIGLSTFNGEPVIMPVPKNEKVAVPAFPQIILTTIVPPLIILLRNVGVAAISDEHVTRQSLVPNSLCFHKS
jgi:hypothetical protein